MHNLKGEVLDSVLVVHCKQRVRLEDISKEGKWERTHTFWHDSKKEVMTKVRQSLGSS